MRGDGCNGRTVQMGELLYGACDKTIGIHE